MNMKLVNQKVEAIAIHFIIYLIIMSDMNIDIACLSSEST